MRKGARVLLLLAAAVFAEGKLGGRITGGKAKKLLDQGLPLIKKGDELFKRHYVLEYGTDEEREVALKEAIKHYDKGTTLLQRAVEIQEDPGVNWRLTLAARNLARSRAWVLRRENARRARKRPRPPPPPDEPEENPGEKPKRQPDPIRPVPREKSREKPQEFVEHKISVAFNPGDPPAQPVDVELERPEFVSEKEAKKAKGAIRKRISEYYQALRPGKLRQRHRLCGGKGRFSDGSVCDECYGTGEGINLHHFRKVYWTGFSPLLRSAEGGLDALEAFYARAVRKPPLLGPIVKSSKVEEIEFQGTWARAKVVLTTDEGKQERYITLVSIGSNWFFYTPATDKELFVQEGEG